MKMKQVWNCGGGTQSCAIGGLIVQGRLPKPDAAVIVDTEREKGSTWEYYDNVLFPALKSVGVHLHRVRKSDYATCDLYSVNGETLEIPAFTTQVMGKVSKLDNFCSHEWKTRVAARFLRDKLGIQTKETVKWMGFSLDETRRWMKQEGNPQVRLPLVKDVPMYRQQAIDFVKSLGWPTPPRSACWMCPNQRPNEWKETKENRPHEFEAAQAIEAQVRERDAEVWLTRYAKPLGEVDFDALVATEEEERACDSGNCFL